VVSKPVVANGLFITLRVGILLGLTRLNEINALSVLLSSKQYTRSVGSTREDNYGFSNATFVDKLQLAAQDMVGKS
jgi:hypothetical protein